MGYLILLLGLLQLGELRRGSSPRALLLGLGLVLAGLAQLVGEGSFTYPWLSTAAWPVLIAALYCSWRDGTLGMTYRCKPSR